MNKYKHFTWDDRIRIETMLDDGKEPKEIAQRLKCHISSVYRERKRGEYQKNVDWHFVTAYSPDIAENKYRMSLSSKGAPLKIGNDHALANFIEQKILKDRYSPGAVLMYIEQQELSFSVTMSKPTLYRYIDMGLFLNITNKDLPCKINKKNPYRQIRRARPLKGESIEQRPGEVNERSTFGHWEMDTVKGKATTKKTLLVLTERQTRNEIKRPMAANTNECVEKVLNSLERKYRKVFSTIFKTITVDNGSEFLNCDALERSCLFRENRTKIYYCHPYSSWERGSNENNNKLIRRWIPKGTPIENFTNKQLAEIERWMNDYPRAIFGGRSSEMLFREQLLLLGLTVDKLLKC